ncbi:MAG: hypothetical protein NC911_09945 [Candidatus Omnitrophica bacterium]|nr:hypothetical protein [Candidatus Omnitrophota bacterium]
MIVYYSRTGNTKSLAEFLKDQLSAEIQEIKTNIEEKGKINFIRAGWQAVKKFCPELSPIRVDLGRYDLVLIGTPVWALTMASPIRSFLKTYHSKLPAVGFFATMGKVGSESTFAHMADLVGKKPLACLAVSEQAIKSGSFQPKAKEFVISVRTYLEKKMCHNILLGDNSKQGKI